MYTPKVSIIIPAYNASNYLAQAIDAALAQTYQNTEVIVVNDGSDDGEATERIALSYGDRIRYFHKENGGSSSALNMGIANMTGDWFSWLSHDDLYVPEKISTQIQSLTELNVPPKENSEHIFFSAFELINAQGKVIRYANKDSEYQLAKKIESFPHNGYLICEPSTYSFHGCSCLINKKAFERVGAFNEKLRILNDWDMWFRLYAAGYKIHYIPAPLVYGRIHSAQVSNSIGYSYHNAEQDMFWNRSLDWMIEHYPKEEVLFLQFAKNAFLKTRDAEGERALEQVNMSKARKYIIKCMYRFYASSRCLARKICLKFKV